MPNAWLANVSNFNGLGDDGGVYLAPSRESCISLGQLRKAKICEALGSTQQSTLDYYGRNVQRSLITIKSLCGTRLTRGSVTTRCQPRFQTTYKSFPGLIVHRNRVFVPTF